MIDRLLSLLGLQRRHSRWCLENELTQLRAENGHLRELLALERSTREYWQKRAELFLDRAAAQQGITHEPVMTEPSKELDGFLKATGLGGAAMMEYDGGRN